MTERMQQSLMSAQKETKVNTAKINMNKGEQFRLGKREAGSEVTATKKTKIL